ncbi:MAG: penicillin-binding protein 2 [Deltaproteobacteria bacterium]|nr:MAG: penicillin-binding protein 2 [Deltaproteobacteria bacterium]
MRPSNFDPISVDILNRQLKKATIVVLIFFVGLLFRLWYLQVVNGWKYREKSENNRIHLQDIPPLRGMIFDRNGRLLVDNRAGYDLCVIPEDVQDPEGLLDRLNNLVGIDLNQARQLYRKGLNSLPFKTVRIKRNLSRDELAVIETHRFNLPGITIQVRPQRHYLYNHLAVHVLGYLGEITEQQLASGKYVNNRGGDLIGKSGMERQWQRILNGIPGGEQVEVDAAGRKLHVISRKKAIPGANVFLTIDSRLQGVAENALEGKAGAVVAMNPMSGEILAMASSPWFDPNLFVKGIDRETWEGMVKGTNHPLQNRAISGQYPPGSVFKIVVALGALQEGVLDPEEKLFCGGSYRLGKSVYRCWKRAGHGWISLHKGLAQSCDVYFYQVGKTLGIDNISRYARKMGLGARTGLDLPHEKPGLIPTRQWKLRRWRVPWQQGETLSTAIGQSYVLVTPVQMACLISSVFNGGKVLKPQLTKRIQLPGGDDIQGFHAEERWDLGIEKAYLEQVKKALIGVVNEPHGTGGKARMEHVVVAGKTGTAQVVSLPKADRRGKEEEIPEAFRDHAWFVAIAPANQPKIAVAVVVEHGGHGGSAAGPIAKEVISAYLGTN